LASNTAIGFSGNTKAKVLGLAGALVAARYAGKKTPAPSQQH